MKRLIMSLMLLAVTGLTAGSALADGMGGNGSHGGANGVMGHPIPKPAPTTPDK